VAAGTTRPGPEPRARPQNAEAHPGPYLLLFNSSQRRMLAGNRLAWYVADDGEEV